MRILFVINPKSGNQTIDGTGDKISDFCIKNHHEYEITYTRGEGDIERISKKINEFRPSSIVAVGGDGTVNLVASNAIQHNLNLGIIPAGSANGLAYNLEIPGDPEKALSRLKEGKARPLDVIYINNEHYCLHLSDIGINARVVKRFEKEDTRGLGGYAIQLFKELRSTGKSFRARIKTGDLHKKVKAEMIVIANARSFGTGAQINPLGRHDDGVFEIIVIKPYRWWFIFRVLVSFFTGRLHTLKYVDVYSAEYVEISCKTAQVFQVDGEVIDGIRTIKAEMHEAALKVHY